MLKLFAIVTLVAFTLVSSGHWVVSAWAQTKPGPGEISKYDGLHKAAHEGNTSQISQLIAAGANIEERDGAGRTPLIIAVFASNDSAVQLLMKAGADANAFDHQKYDIVTIAAVANDVSMLKLVLKNGASAKNITSPYDGTALIAAAHLGHVEVVKALIGAGAPLDHINNLAWTALIEVVVLGDGGPNHVECARALLAAGADKSIGDRDGVTPLQHARNRGFTKMVALF